MSEDRTAEVVFTVSGWEEIVYSKTYTIEPESTTEPARSDANYDVVSSINGNGNVKWANEVKELRLGESIVVPPGEAYQVSSGSDSQLKFQVLGVENARKDT